MAEIATKTKTGRVPPESAEPGPRLRRRPLLMVLAVGLVAAGAVLGVVLWAWSASGADVVMVRAEVQRGHPIAASDLGVVRVAVDPSVRTVPGPDMASMVGRRAAVDLTAGTLLAPGQLTDTLPPGSGMSVVGVPVVPGSMPSEPLRAGDTVRLVQTPGQAGEVTGTPVTFTATVLSVVPGDAQTVVDVVVSADKAAELAARAATGRVAVVLDSRAR